MNEWVNGWMTMVSKSLQMSFWRRPESEIPDRVRDDMGEVDITRCHSGEGQNLRDA